MASSPARTDTKKLDREQIEARILAGLQGDIEPVPVSTIYKIGLLVVAFLMILLPAVYIAIIGVTAYLVFLHATTNVSVLGQGRGGVIGYILPLLVGAILIIFMIKPLFARRANSQTPRRLKRESEPFLYEYVEWICDAVGAPVPSSIRVDCDVNASAGFRRGIWSMFGNDLTLTLGLPLVKGLTLKQFSGVLAHEFGHFSQGAGMRLTYVIRSIDAWFARVVYERDAWDEKLTGLSHSLGYRIGLIFWASRLMIWVTRKILQGLMMLGHMVSCFMLREMEFDADRYEARLAGSETFEQTHDRIVELSFAYRMSLEDIGTFWDEGRLADDIARYVSYKLTEFTEDEINKLHDMDDEQKTGLFDTHPASRDRIASAYRENSAGIITFSDKLPAEFLFRNFNRMSQQTSFEFYREHLGDEVKKDSLFPVDDLVERKQAEIEAGKSLRRYFQVQIPILRPLPLSEDARLAPVDPKATRDFMVAAREKMLSLVESYRENLKRMDDAEEKMFDAIRAMATLRTGLKIKAKEFGLNRSSMDEAREANEKAREKVELIGVDLAEFEDQVAIRLACALQLLQVDRVVARIEDGERVRDEALSLLPEALFVSESMFDLPSVRVPYTAIIQLVSLLDDHGDNPKVIEQIRKRMKALRDKLSGFQEQLGDHPYPFDHARPDMTLREYALPELPEQDDLAGLFHAIDRMIIQLGTVQIRLFARLAQAAEKVETAFGLPMLEEPEEEDEEELDEADH